MAQCLFQQCLVKPEKCTMLLDQVVGMDPSIGYVEMGCCAIFIKDCTIHEPAVALFP